MKKMMLGGLLFIGGIIGVLGLFIVAALNPWDYKGITGVMGSLLGMRAIIPFLMFCTLSITGLVICVYEAYVRG